MPLRDHFRPPLEGLRHWEGVHGGWPMAMVMQLVGKLPSRYFAEPRVHPGGSAELDVATFENDRENHAQHGNGNGAVAVATSVWAPPRPTLSVVTDLPASDEYEIRVHDSEHGSRLVAAVEIVSPANKDRPETRQAFVSKCSSLLQQRVSVTIVDLVTRRHFNLYEQLLEQLGQHDPTLEAEDSIYTVACRTKPENGNWRFETWARALEIGLPLPTLPLWLADDLAIPLDLEQSYEDTCRALRIP